MLLVKLGGSAITYKDKPMRARIDVIERLAKEIAEALEETGERALIVHGAGSFGHPHVIKHGLADGFLKEKRKAQLRGFAITHNSVALLSGLINGALIHHGVPAVSLPPLALLRQKKKRISHFNIVPTRILLKNGFVPLLHGDIVFDEAIGCSVCSGDQIVAYLARVFKPKRIVFGVDVDGIFDRDPKKNKNAKLIPYIDARELAKIMHSVSGAEHDVTGGMAGKIGEIARMSKAAKEIFVVNALRKNRLRDALLGKSVIGTRMHI